MEFQDDELQEILNIFNVESEEIISRLNDNLMALEKSPTNKDVLILLFRDAHSLKGASRMIGFAATQNLAHKLEDTLGLAKEDKLIINSQIADVMYKTVDLISNIIKQSIESGKEKYSKNEVDTQTKALEEVQNKFTQVQQQENSTPVKKEEENTIDEQKEIPQRRSSDKQKEFSKKNFIKYYYKCNSVIIDTLKCVIKLSEKIENKSIEELLGLINTLLEYFQQINHFEIKSTLDTIKLKLDVIEKCGTELTIDEVAEIQQELDNIINQLTNLCEINNLETVDYYGFAFSDNVYEIPQNEMLQEDEEDNVIEPELIVDNTISALPQFSKDFDIDAILSQVQSLENSSDAYADLSEFFNEIKNQSDNKELLQVIDKILSIIEFAKNLNITLEESVIEILSNGVKFCKAIVNGETPQDDGALLAQQLTVAKQLIEIANPQTKELATVNTDDNSPQNSNSFAKMKDFSHIFDTGVIKTLHVESSKLDAMVSQIGELIATKIKTTKQLSELNNLNDKLEDWQKDFSKLIRHLKSYDKRYSKPDSEGDSSSIIFIKQMLNALTEQN